MPIYMKVKIQLFVINELNDPSISSNQLEQLVENCRDKADSKNKCPCLFKLC